MKRIFLDTSVLFSAAYSSKGYSRELILMAARGEIIIVISDFVLTEARRNLAGIDPAHLAYLNLILETIDFEYAHASKRDVIQAAKWVALKDAPIIAAAKKSRIDLLVTLDKKHLLGKSSIAEYLGTEIVTPIEAVSRLQG